MKIDIFWENMQLKLYKKLSSFFLTKHIVWNIRTRYAILKPASEKSIILGTMKILNGCILVVGMLSAGFVILRGASIYTYLIWFSLYFMITGQIIRGSLWKEEYKILTQFEKYLGDVCHYYHIGSLVEDALYDSIEEAPYEISLHMQKICDVLFSEEEEELEEEPEFFSLLAILSSVLLPAMPSADRPFAFWKSYTASLVRLPKLPVTEPV